MNKVEDNTIDWLNEMVDRYKPFTRKYLHNHREAAVEKQD